MNRIIGLNSTGFNTSSAFIEEGIVRFAIEEERITREKRTRKFPTAGLSLGLDRLGWDLCEVDAVAISWNPMVNLETHSTSHSDRARYLGEFLYSAPSNLMSLVGSQSGPVSQQIISFENGQSLPIYYVDHHTCHRANFFLSTFEEAAVLTVDAFGEKKSTSYGLGVGGHIKELWSQEFPHSLGGFYSTLTEFLGFVAQGDEWKLMGASSYGDPEEFYDVLREVVNLQPEGGFELDLSYFNFYQFHRPLRYTEKLSNLLGVQPNVLGAPLTPQYFNLAAAAQVVFEEIYFHLLSQLQRQTKSPNIVISGGCALNSVANGKILDKTDFDALFVPPIPDDSGAALGAAHYVHHHVIGGKRAAPMTSNYWGPSYTNDEISTELKKYKIDFRHSETIVSETAQLLAEGNIIGWFQGALEFGDRALGNRSILADPREEGMNDRVNATVKYREPFRPFAPSVLAEHVDNYFENPQPAPYMERVLSIYPEMRKKIPAVTHIDGTGRLQTVYKDFNPRYHELIEEFFNLTGIPIILNTSFNLKGEPIVCTPEDAIRTFYSSGLDILVLGDFLVRKTTTQK